LEDPDVDGRVIYIYTHIYVAQYVYVCVCVCARERVREIKKDLRAKDHLEDPDVAGRVILRRKFRKWDVGVRTGSIWIGIGTGDGQL
jgi:hypothetical protein